MRRETHFGKVLSNADPEKAGGAKVQVNDLVGDGPLDPEDFVPTRFPVAGDDEGFYFAPPKGGAAEVEATADESEGVEDLAPVLVGMRFTSKDAIPEEFRSDPTKRGGIKWGSDVLLFDKAQDRLALVSGNVRLGEEEAAEEVLRGTTFNQEFNAFLGQLSTFVAATAGLPGMAGPAGTFGTQIANFQGKFATWLSTKVKTE
jgi:hypothetical protein